MPNIPSDKSTLLNVMAEAGSRVTLVLSVIFKFDPLFSVNEVPVPRINPFDVIVALLPTVKAVAVS